METFEFLNLLQVCQRYGGECPGTAVCAFVFPVAIGVVLTVKCGVALQVHGFPKVMGVLTHLDGFREASQLKKTKKKLKQRFWTEIYDGAKLFYLSGIQHGE